MENYAMIQTQQRLKKKNEKKKSIEVKHTVRNFLSEKQHKSKDEEKKKKQKRRKKTLRNSIAIAQTQLYCT